MLKSVGGGILTDVDVVVGARDVLLGCNRSRSGGDSYWVVNRCCVNNNQNVVLCPSDTPPKPITITVEEWYRREGVEGWVEVGRKRKRKVWMRAKEGRIVYWERRGGRKVGEVELKNAHLEELTDPSPAASSNPVTSCLIIRTSNKDLHIRFPAPSNLTQWKLVLTEEISLQAVFTDAFKEDDHVPPPPGSSPEATSGKKKMNFMNVLSRHKKDSSDGEGRKASLSNPMAKNPGISPALVSNRSASLPDIMSVSPSSSSFSHPQPSSIPTRVQIGVHITVSVSNEYKVCTTDPDGEDDDVWAVVEGVFEQGYWLEKGEEVIRGEETVKINLID